MPKILNCFQNYVICELVTEDHKKSMQSKSGLNVADRANASMIKLRVVGITTTVYDRHKLSFVPGDHVFIDAGDLFKKDSDIAKRWSRKVGDKVESFSMIPLSKVLLHEIDSDATNALFSEDEEEDSEDVREDN